MFETPMTRRSLLRTSALVPVAAIVGCASLPGGSSSGLAGAISDIGTIASGLLGVLPGLSAVPGIPSGVLGQATSIINELQHVAGTVGSAASASAAATPMKQFESLLNTVVQAVTPFVAGVPGVGEVFMAASVLLPVAETAIGLIANVVAPAMRTARAMGSPQARLILQTAAHR